MTVSMYNDFVHKYEKIITRIIDVLVFQPICTKDNDVSSTDVLINST